MTDAMMNKPTNWMPLVRHKRSQNAGVVYTLVDEVMAVVDALMRTSSRSEWTTSLAAVFTDGSPGACRPASGAVRRRHSLRPTSS